MGGGVLVESKAGSTIKGIQKCEVGVLTRASWLAHLLNPFSVMHSGVWQDGVEVSSGLQLVQTGGRPGKPQQRLGRRHHQRLPVVAELLPAQQVVVLRGRARLQKHIKIKW